MITRIQDLGLMSNAFTAVLHPGRRGLAHGSLEASCRWLVDDQLPGWEAWGQLEVIPAKEGPATRTLDNPKRQCWRRGRQAAVLWGSPQLKWLLA